MFGAVNRRSCWNLLEERLWLRRNLGSGFGSGWKSRIVVCRDMVRKNRLLSWNVNPSFVDKIDKSVKNID